MLKLGLLRRCSNQVVLVYKYLLMFKQLQYLGRFQLGKELEQNRFRHSSSLLDNLQLQTHLLSRTASKLFQRCRGSSVQLGSSVRVDRPRLGPLLCLSSREMVNKSR